MPSIRISDFDTWRPGYGLATVEVQQAGTGVLAAIFTDENLTEPAENPQTLLSLTDASGANYGKFSVPLYVGGPFQLRINNVDRTGVTRPPLTTLNGIDASDALARVTGGSQDIAVGYHLARQIDVRDFGQFRQVGDDGASASTNNATLVNAIGAAGARGGAILMLPAGTYQVTNFTIPQGVVLRGQGREATILQSTQAGHIATIGGARAGLSRMTIDGVTLVSGSVGVYGEAKEQIVLEDVQIKRFEVGFWQKGGTNSSWYDLFISNCVFGYRGHADSGGDNFVATLSFNHWRGGKVDFCSGKGVEFLYVDGKCVNNIISDVGFEGNTDEAVHIEGARSVTLYDCWWHNNTKNLVVLDPDPVNADNTIFDVSLQGGSIENGTIELEGTLESVIFQRINLTDVEIEITTPGYNILALDCRELEGVTFTGLATAWIRRKSNDHGASSGLTTGNSATKAWAIALAPGQQVYLEAKVVGRQRNGINTGFYHVAVSAGRPGATLAYDTQTENFVVGEILTGQTSGATARITADSDSGATGTLTLQDVVGTFEDNEIITGETAGSATANGTQSFSNAALVGSVTSIRTAQETDADWNATFVANGPEIELRVTGDTGHTIEWTADVSVVST